MVHAIYVGQTCFLSALVLACVGFASLGVVCNELNDCAWILGL